MPDFEMPYFVDSSGNKGHFKDTTAREQVAEITDGMDIKTVIVTWPSSGTMLERSTDIITQVLENTTFSKQFTIVNVLENNAASTRLGSLLYSIAGNAGSGNYGEGIFFSYYTDIVCKAKNANGTITVKQLAEV